MSRFAKCGCRCYCKRPKFADTGGTEAVKFCRRLSLICSNQSPLVVSLPEKGSINDYFLHSKIVCRALFMLPRVRFMFITHTAAIERH